MMQPLTAISLLELNRRILRAVTDAPGLNDIWVTAETSDLRVSGGHCYMELIQKDEDTGAPLAKSRAVIWASAYPRISARFVSETGTPLRSDMKIMARVSAAYHPVYGLSLVISDINPEYTVGDLARRRNAIIARLREEGVYDLNRTLPWEPVPWRVAVISARGAAGYGDFMKHLLLNPRRLRFRTELFEATMQGDRTVPSIISALEAVMAREDEFDSVVIIRGGGAVSDLASFDDYDLAANVAQFPLPVIVGIGHERDITVLDYVANTRVKTPTAAAEILIGHVAAAYDRLCVVGREIMTTVSQRVAAQHQQLAYYSGTLPALVRNILDSNRRRLGPDVAAALVSAVRNSLQRSGDRLEAMSQLLTAVSPEATLRRGFSITRLNGRAVTDSSVLRPGDKITTTFAGGPEKMSTVNP